MFANLLPWFPGDPHHAEQETQVSVNLEMTSRKLRTATDISTPSQSTEWARHLTTLVGTTAASVLKSYGHTGAHDKWIGFIKLLNACLDGASRANVPAGSFGFILCSGQTYSLTSQLIFDLTFDTHDLTPLSISYGRHYLETGVSTAPYWNLTMLEIVVPWDHLSSFDPTMNFMSLNNSTDIPFEPITYGQVSSLPGEMWGYGGSSKLSIAPTSATFGADNAKMHNVSFGGEYVISPPNDGLAHIYVPSITEGSSLLTNYRSAIGAGTASYSRWALRGSHCVRVVPSNGLVPTVMTVQARSDPTGDLVTELVTTSTANEREITAPSEVTLPELLTRAPITQSRAITPTSGSLSTRAYYSNS